jgi:hypothetical protein
MATFVLKPEQGNDLKAFFTLVHDTWLFVATHGRHLRTATISLVFRFQCGIRVRHRFQIVKDIPEIRAAWLLVSMRGDHLSHLCHGGRIEKRLKR